MNILLFGTGGHAKVVADMVEKEGINHIVGLVSQDGHAGNFVPGYNVIANNFNFERIIDKVKAKGAIVALGDTIIRRNLVKRIKKHLEFVTAIHPSAVIDNSVSIGCGTVVMAGVVINSSSSIGRHCIVNTSSSIDHDCKIGDFTHICPGSHMAGHVNVGKGCLIGIGSAIIDHIIIGDNVVIGAGTVVINNIPKNVTAIGVPAKVIRMSKEY